MLNSTFNSHVGVVQSRRITMAYYNSIRIQPLSRNNQASVIVGLDCFSILCWEAQACVCVRPDQLDWHKKNMYIIAVRFDLKTFVCVVRKSTLLCEQVIDIFVYHDILDSVREIFMMKNGYLYCRMRH